MRRTPKKTAKERAKKAFKTAGKIGNLTLEDLSSLKHPQVSMKHVLKYGGKENKPRKKKQNKKK